MTIISAIKASEAELTQWRREIHTHPEIAFEEHRTAHFVEQKLKSFGVLLHPRMAGTGVIGSLTMGQEKRSIALRADLDALPVEELNNFDHCSKESGKMHACGHDGHTVMLLAAAKYLADTKRFNGTVYFIFQPAEENEGGGRKMVEQGLFDKYPVDGVYGMHNWPGLELGKFAVKSGPVMAAYDVFDMVISGKGGHAAQPHKSIDPIVIASQLVGALQTIGSRNTSPLDAIVVSVTRIHAGDSYNVIPEQAYLAGTVRTFCASVQENAMRRIQQIADGICHAYGGEVQLNYQKRYPATINSVAETQHALVAATQVVGKENVVLDKAPSMGSEDFSFMLNACRGSYVWVGNGDSAGLHNPHYDFNDNALVIGASYWVRLVETQLAVE